jgi:3-deoxy-D-manno-octulosonate 8-phosphate phosphatase KdsC-like HAD superfamily phosphatase
MSSEKLLVLDLDGTLIPFDFLLDSLKILPRLTTNARTKLLLQAFQIFKPIMYKTFKIIIIIFVKILDIPINYKKYLSFSVSASFYAAILKLLPYESIYYYVNISLLEGLYRRRNVWRIALKMCSKQRIPCILVTGNSCEQLIHRLRQLINLKYIFRSYMLKRGPFYFVFVINKYIIAKTLRTTKKAVVVVTDSVGDLSVFNYAQCKIWVKDTSLVKLCSKLCV